MEEAGFDAEEETRKAHEEQEKLVFKEHMRYHKMQDEQEKDIHEAEVQQPYVHSHGHAHRHHQHSHKPTKYSSKGPGIKE